MGGPMMPMGMRQPVRQGTSKMVPVVVSAGLAVGVFCGLLFGLGVGHAPEPAKASNGAKQSEESQVQTAAVSMGTKAPPKAAATPTTPAAGSATGSAAAAAAGSAAAAAAPAAPKPGKIAIDIQPDSAAQAAKILVDGKPVTGKSAEVVFEAGVTKKSVKVVVRVPGYKDIEKAIDVEADAESSISFDLKGVRPAAGGDTAAASTGGAKDSGAKDSGAKDSGAKDSGAKDSGGGKTNSTKGTGKGTGKGSGKGSGLIDI